MVRCHKGIEARRNAPGFVLLVPESAAQPMTAFHVIRMPFVVLPTGALYH